MWSDQLIHQPVPCFFQGYSSCNLPFSFSDSYIIQQWKAMIHLLHKNWEESHCFLLPSQYMCYQRSPSHDNLRRFKWWLCRYNQKKQQPLHYISYQFFILFFCFQNNRDFIFLLPQFMTSTSEISKLKFFLCQIQIFEQVLRSWLNHFPFKTKTKK
jgi:hypothetical protein